MKLEQWEVELLMDCAVRLTEIAQRGCEHLCVEEMAVIAYEKLATQYVSMREGFSHE